MEIEDQLSGIENARRLLRKNQSTVDISFKNPLPMRVDNILQVKRQKLDELRKQEKISMLHEEELQCTFRPILGKKSKKMARNRTVDDLLNWKSVSETKRANHLFDSVVENEISHTHHILPNSKKIYKQLCQKNRTFNLPVEERCFEQVKLKEERLSSMRKNSTNDLFKPKISQYSIQLASQRPSNQLTPDKHTLVSTNHIHSLKEKPTEKMLDDLLNEVIQRYEKEGDVDDKKPPKTCLDRKSATKNKLTLKPLEKNIKKISRLKQARSHTPKDKISEIRSDRLKSKTPIPKCKEKENLPPPNHRSFNKQRRKAAVVNIVAEEKNRSPQSRKNRRTQEKQRTIEINSRKKMYENFSDIVKIKGVAKKRKSCRGDRLRNLEQLIHDKFSHAHRETDSLQQSSIETELETYEAKDLLNRLKMISESYCPQVAVSKQPTIQRYFEFDDCEDSF